MKNGVLQLLHLKGSFIPETSPKERKEKDYTSGS